MVKIIDWQLEVQGNLEYIDCYNEVKKIYLTNEEFRKDANSTTLEVLKNASETKLAHVENSIKIAVDYLLQEFAFMEFSPNLLKCKSAVYIYHKSWPVFEKYINGQYDKKLKENLGFKIIKIA